MLSARDKYKISDKVKEILFNAPKIKTLAIDIRYSEDIINNNIIIRYDVEEDIYLK